MADRFNRRVSTRISKGKVAPGVCRVFTGIGAERVNDGRLLPTCMLDQVAKLPAKVAVKFVARKAGVPRVRVNELVWSEKEARWWLVVDW